MNTDIEIPKSPLNTGLIHNGEIAAVEDLVMDMQKPVIDTDPITLAVRIKRAQDQLESWRRKLVGIANQCFVMIKAEHPGKAWQVSGAKITDYVPAGVWTWPADVSKLMADLEAAKDKAKADGTAKFSAGKLGVDTFAFKVSLLAETSGEPSEPPKNPRIKVGSKTPAVPS